MTKIFMLFLVCVLTACVSGNKKPEKQVTNQSTVYELSRSAVYDMLKHFRNCYNSGNAAKENYIVLFRSEVFISDDLVKLNAFDISTVHPLTTEVNLCADEARKIGDERLQQEWLQAKAILKLGQHTVISNGEIVPKARYNTTDLNTGVTEVGY
jgi:hypothetical protein